MDATIRPATAADARFLASVVITAGRAHVEQGIWDVILGRTNEANLSFMAALAVAEPRHFFHYSTFFVAEVAGRPVAGASGYDPKYLGQKQLIEAVSGVFDRQGISAAEQSACWKRAGQVVQCLADEAADLWVVANVATLAAYRRQGLSAGLLEKVLERGRLQGFRRVQVSSYLGNTPAINAYQKLGFRVVYEKRDPGFARAIGTPGMVHLQRDL